MKAVSLLLVCHVCALPGVVFSLSCSQIVSRTQTIEDSFCGQYSSSDVYTARVVGATCNCIPASGDANLQCQDYTFATGNTSVVNVEVVNRVMCRASFGGAPRCMGLATSLVDSGITLENVTTNLPPVVNRTDEYGYCFNSCPFQNISLRTPQPCVYTVEVTRVFKGNYTRGETLVVVGPDSLIAFGYPGRVLRLQEEYVVGIGGFCSDIAEWSTVASYSSSELNLLRELASGCPGPTKGPTKGPQGPSLSSGAVAGVVLGGVVFLIVLAGIAVCVGVLVYGYQNPTSKIGLFMIEHRPKSRHLNKKSASYNVESGTTVVKEKE